MFNLHIDKDSIEFWQGAKKGKLMVQKCLKTNNFFLYSRGHFNGSAADDYIWVEASGNGAIYSFTISHIPGGSDYYINKIPYVVASIKLVEGVSLISNIVDSNLKNIEIGKKVRVKFVKLNEEITFPCFQLIK